MRHKVWIRPRDNVRFVFIEVSQQLYSFDNYLQAMLGFKRMLFSKLEVSRFIYLSKGCYFNKSIIGSSEDEELLKDVVEINQELSYWEDIRDIFYKNYLPEEQRLERLPFEQMELQYWSDGFTDAKDSLDTLIYTLGLDPTKKILILKENG